MASTQDPRVFTQADDFCTESDALYRLVSPLSDEEFEQTTQFKGWTLNDVVSHLHVWNQAADQALNDPAAFRDFFARAARALAGGDLREFERDWQGGHKGIALLSLWQGYYPAMSKRFAAADPKARVKWAGPDMSVRTSITARQMETWAHGQEVFDQLGVERVDTDRIRNIAVLGVNTFGFTFENRGEPPPGPAPHVKLTAPSGDVWEWNTGQATSRVSGSATEFCQVVTQIRNIADTQLEVSGAAAHAWMAAAQCFAGPPVAPPAPGSRFRCGHGSSSKT